MDRKQEMTIKNKWSHAPGHWRGRVNFATKIIIIIISCHIFCHKSIDSGKQRGEGLSQRRVPANECGRNGSIRNQGKDHPSADHSVTGVRCCDLEVIEHILVCPNIQRIYIIYYWHVIYMCAHVFVCILVEARGGHQVSCSMSLHLILLRQEFLDEPGAYYLPASTGQLASPEDPPVSTLTSTGVAGAHSHTRDFMQVLGIQTLKLVQQVLSSTVRLLDWLFPLAVCGGLLWEIRIAIPAWLLVGMCFASEMRTLGDNLVFNRTTWSVSFYWWVEAIYI